MITEHSVSTLFLCNHEEVDSQLVLHATESDTEVVVVSKDTDVFALLVMLKRSWNRATIGL